MNMRKLIAWLHRWLGAVSSLFILLIALSGTMLAFMGELFLLQHGEILHASPPSSKSEYATVETLIDSATDGYGSAFKTMGVLMPRTRIDKVETAIVFGLPAGTDSVDQLLMLSVDPWTAAYKGDFLLRHTFGHELVEFHHSLLLGEAGIVFVCVIALLLIVMCLSGLYMWWPRQGSVWRKASTISFRGNLKRIVLSLHGLVGVWLSLLILFFSISGIATAKPGWFEPLLVAPTHEPPTTSEFEQTCDGIINVGQAQSSGESVFPERSLAFFFLPNRENGPYLLTYREMGDGNKLEGDGRVFVHASCKDVVHVEDLHLSETPRQLANMMLSLHGGYSFGKTFGDILVLLCGIGLIGLAGSGLYLFLTGFFRSNQQSS